MEIETSLPIYKGDSCDKLTKTGIWMKDWDWSDNRVEGPKYRHYYLAAHLKNGTLPQHEESQDEKQLKGVAYGLIPGPTMLFGGIKLQDRFIKHGKKSIAMWPLLVTGAVLSHPVGILVSGITLRSPILIKREKIEDKAEKLAIATIEKNYNGRGVFKMTQYASRFKAF